MHLRMTGNLLLREPDEGAVADLMEVEPLGGPRLYEGSPELKHLAPASSSTTVASWSSPTCGASARRCCSTG